MKIWRDGDESSGICPTCERRTRVQFRRRTIDLESPRVRVSGVLVAVCSKCDGIAMIPQQSTPRLRAGIERGNTVLNVRVPGQLVDVLGLIGDRWAPAARSSTAAVLRILLREFGNDPAFARRTHERVADGLTSGPADRDLSVRVPLHVLAGVDEMAARLGIATRADVVRGLIATAKHELLDRRNPELAVSIERALGAVA